MKYGSMYFYILFQKFIIFINNTCKKFKFVIKSCFYNLIIAFYSIKQNTLIIQIFLNIILV